MPSYQNASEIPAPDIAIIGGGIVGLWTAYYAAQTGEQVLLIEKDVLGSPRAASNGLLGALMPHQPINWNDKKQFQLDGLTTLPDEIAKIEKSTGIECGYFRCGRVMPVGNGEKRKQSETWARSAQDVWVSPFEWKVTDQNPAEEWMIDKGSHGYNSDTLSARVNPRALVASLVAHLRTLPNVSILENCGLAEFRSNGELLLVDGTCINSGKTIVTAGYQSFDLLEPLTNKSLGWGVKGQAARLEPAQDINTAAPIIYDNGTYVIAHEDGTVAVGSTSERNYDDPHTTDTGLDQVIAEATALCPQLEGAEVLERWAGVRPRATGRDPMIGTLPQNPDIVVATGGFKITLAIAHIMARCALSAASGDPSIIPESFRVEAHL